MGTAEYFDEALLLFTALPAFHTDELSLAGRRVHLNTPSPALRQLFLFSLSHLLTETDGAEADLTIWYAEDNDLPQKMTAPPWPDFNAQGYNPELDQGDVQVFFQPWQKQVFLYSRTKRTGIYWVIDAAEVPWWETTFSFRIIFHFWTRDLPAQLVHAGAIANAQSCVLITGPSGSGKSTSCLNLLREGYQYLGDDYVWVELEPQLVVHALYQTAKVEADNFQARFKDWEPFLKNPDSYHSQKAILDVKKLFPAQWLPSAKIKAILLPNVSGLQQTRFEHAPSTRAFFAMAPTTLHHLPHHRNIAYQKLVHLSQAVPAYNLHLGFNITTFQSAFNQFINNA